MMRLKTTAVLLASAWFMAPMAGLQAAYAQQQAAATAAPAATPQAPTPLTDEELEILVARIALYPDELVAVIAGASLFPLQIVEAARFLDQHAKDASLKPKESWDGSVISLLNYPEIVKMMSDDLEWTQTLGDALTSQQKDVLVAIQQLREKAVADGVIKSDDKMTVTKEDDNVVIQSASKEAIYIPQYAPEMLYEPSYQPVPITYYPEPYEPYYSPLAPFFAATVTGVVWAAAVDWDDWGVWGGGYHGGDIDIDCNKCFNDIDLDGKINFNDVDWKNIDRSKINFDKNQFAKFDRTNIQNNIKLDQRNNIQNKAANIRNERPGVGPGTPGRPGPANDIRKSTLDGLKNKPSTLPAGKPNIGAGDRPNLGGGNKPNIGAGGGNKPNVGGGDIKRPAAKPAKVDRPAGKPKPAARVDNRPKSPSGLGNVRASGKREQMSSNRGGRSMGGGQRGGGGRHHGGGGGGRRR